MAGAGIVGTGAEVGGTAVEVVVGLETESVRLARLDPSNVLDVLAGVADTEVVAADPAGAAFALVPAIAVDPVVEAEIVAIDPGPTGVREI